MPIVPHSWPAYPERPSSPVVSEAGDAPLPSWASYDSRRFRSTCRGIGLVAVADDFGQVAVADPGGRLVCQLLVDSGRFACRMPDGTRLGPAELVGGPSTPGAEVKIAEALRSSAARG